MLECAIFYQLINVVIFTNDALKSKICWNVRTLSKKHATSIVFNLSVEISVMETGETWKNAITTNRSPWDSGHISHMRNS